MDIEIPLGQWMFDVYRDRSWPDIRLDSKGFYVAAIVPVDNHVLGTLRAMFCAQHVLDTLYQGGI